MSTVWAGVKTLLEIREEEMFIINWHGQIVNIFVNTNMFDYFVGVAYDLNNNF
jgi:hypothetical protein